MEYYIMYIYRNVIQSLKKVLQFVATRMNLEGIILSEISQTEKDTV